MDSQLFYVDNNAFINIKKNINKYEALNENPINVNQIVYSPAHLEELANSNRNDILTITPEIYADLNLLDKITNTVAFLPSKNKGIEAVKEESINGYVRVVNEYDKTIVSEIHEIVFLICRSLIRKEKGLHIRGSEIKNILESDTVKKYLSDSQQWYKEYCVDKDRFWSKYKNNYEFMFHVMEVISNLIDVLDNNPEPSRLYRSHMHDVTHFIYASHADFFITDDRRLREKFLEIKRFFNIDTKLLRFAESPFYIGDV